MIFAIILAGGSGTRTGLTVPKQFVEVKGKPILVYTLERFDNHPMIDSIVVVCKEGWEETVSDLIKRFNLRKVIKIVQGGNSAIESIEQGLSAMSFDANDIVVIHESVRPMVEDKMIEDVIHKAKETGAAMSASPLKEHFFLSTQPGSVSSYYPKENMYRSSSPQAFRYGVISEAMKRAQQDGTKLTTAFSSTLIIDTGGQITLSYGSDCNIKITTKQDIIMFSAYISQMYENGDVL